MKILTYITSIDLTGGGPSRSVPMLVKGLAEMEGGRYADVAADGEYEYSCARWDYCKTEYYQCFQ